MAPKVTKAKTRRTHTLGGCGNCRRRHVRCPLERPTCSACNKAKLSCDGYASGMRWVNAEPEDAATNDNEANRTVRRQLYTEKSRRSMSSALAAQVDAKSVAARLSEVDLRTRQHDGPFGVIDFQTLPPNPTTDNIQPTEEASDMQDAIQPWVDPEPLATNTANVPLASTDTNFSLQWDDLFALDFDNELGMSQGDLFSMELNPDLPSNAMAVALPREENGTAADFGTDIQERLPETVLEQAPFLLKYFHDRVIPSMASLPFGSKSPWKIQNVTGAVHTLAEVTYLRMKNIKHAKLANLCALLACASYQLDTLKQTPGNWATIFNLTRREAKEQLQLSLRDELSGPNKAKYKDQLMAVMAVSTIAVITGHKEDARKSIIDTERLLRTRSLAKRYISRRCRMLHHIYTWTRIISESTYVLHDYKTAGIVDRQSHSAGTRSIPPECDRSQGDREARLDNFLRLALTQDDIDDTSPKDPEIGLHDIHLDDPRADQATMYDQIYSLPESWLSLLSRTTKLANVMDAYRLSGRNWSELAQPDILLKRAKKMESMVCLYAARDVVGDPSTPNYHMTRALTAALVIYFYRRIRDVNSWIMQSHVDNVISALKDFDSALQAKELCGPGTAWPAFIAGCEALSKKRRVVLSAWVEKAYKQTGLRGFQAANERMKEVWRRRGECEPRDTSIFSSSIDSSWTWTALSRERGDWILLC